MKHYKSLATLHYENGFPPPENPLFSIHRCNNQCTMGDREFTSDFYMIGFKKIKAGMILYGRTRYDHEKGTMFFMKPRQVIEMTNLEFEEDGLMIFFHEDFLNGDILHNEIKKHSFFEYETNEALHLSPKEEEILQDLFRKMETESKNNQDEFSRAIIIGYISSILTYSQRFYKRQFLNRTNISGKTVSRFTEQLSAWFSQGLVLEKGLPTVTMMAEQLHVSPRYLSDMLKQETGKTAIELIHIYLVSEAKNLLTGTERTIAEVAYELGFENLPYFSRLFRQETGTSPHQYRKQLFN